MTVNASLGRLVRFLATLIALLATAVLAGCGSNSGGSKTAEIPAGGAAPTTPTQAATEPSSSGCKQVQAPKPKSDGGAKKPTAPLDASKAWTLKSAPNASASMVSLAKAGFFKNTIFHRIVPDFVIQGGDPTASGMGGPGYSTRDVPPKGARYTKGVVAMAKAPQEPAGTAGSQFYVVTGADAGLPPDYAVIGKVEKGLPVVERIGQLGGPDEKPTQTVILYDVTASGS
jgi:cyclophilin family peptidyl-prolyl cis-trans isomerase